MGEGGAGKSFLTCCLDVMLDTSHVVSVAGEEERQISNIPATFDFGFINQKLTKKGWVGRSSTWRALHLWAGEVEQWQKLVEIY